MNRARLAVAETESTRPDPDPIGPKNALTRPGEKVAVPSSAMMGTRSYDWSKYGFFLAVFVAVVGVIWQYADTAFTVKSIGEDVKVLQRKADELFRSFASSEARISALERSQSGQSLPPKPDKKPANSSK